MFHPGAPAKDGHQENDQIPHHLIGAPLACQFKVAGNFSVRACRLSKRREGDTTPTASTMTDIAASPASVLRLRGAGQHENANNSETCHRMGSLEADAETGFGVRDQHLERRDLGSWGG